MTSRRVEMDDGGFALLFEDDDGNVEIVEHDSKGREVRRTYGRPDPLPLTFEQALRLPIPDGLSAEEEYDWLVHSQRVFVGGRDSGRVPAAPGGVAPARLRLRSPAQGRDNRTR
jgi:hypothetical protein